MGFQRIILCGSVVKVIETELSRQQRIEINLDSRIKRLENGFGILIIFQRIDLCLTVTYFTGNPTGEIEHRKPNSEIKISLSVDIQLVDEAQSQIVGTTPPPGQRHADLT